MPTWEKNKTLIVITGPTASGKTGLAVRLAQAVNTSIISADSRQCYQGMAIGTAQPSASELAQVPHYFVNEFPVTQAQNAADFERLGTIALQEIFEKSDTAILCGGTGLYIKALLEGLDEMPAVDPGIVSAVEREYKLNGLTWLQETLRREDPCTANIKEWENPARLIRALSFLRSIGESISQYRSGQKKERPFHVIKLALEVPRELLYQRINERVGIMLEAGLEAEVRSLIPYRVLSPLQTVGYSELFDYFDGHLSLDEAIDKIRQHTRNYAKRQLTWLRRDHDITWISAADTAQIRLERLGIPGL